MNYQPDDKSPIERFIVGKVVQESIETQGIPSPSIHRLDRKIMIEASEDPISGSRLKLPDIKYASSSSVFFEIGKVYLFAISDDKCVGSLEVQGTQVLLPDNASISLDSFVDANQDQPFPDLYGFGAGITS